jgi:hypothetical protein
MPFKVFLSLELLVAEPAKRYRKPRSAFHGVKWDVLSVVSSVL